MISRPRSQAEMALDAAKNRLKSAENHLNEAKKESDSLRREIELAENKKASLIKRRSRDYEKHQDADKFEYKYYGREAAETQHEINSLRNRYSTDNSKSKAQEAFYAAQREVSELQKAVEASAQQELLENNYARTHLEERKVEAAEEANRIRAEKERNALATAQQAAQNQLAAARYQAQARAAEMQFDWEQRTDEQSRSHDHARKMQIREHQQQEHLARLSAEIAKKAAEFDFTLYAERAQIDAQAHVIKAREDGEIARRNVSHETDERIREARTLLEVVKQKRGFEAQMEAKILIIKHLLEKDMIKYRAKFSREENSAKIDEIADIIGEIEKNKKAKTNLI